MMRTFVMFLLAIGLAAGAALVANNWLERQRAATVEEVVTVKTKPILVAAVDIPFGTTIGEPHVKVLSVPEEQVTDANFQSLEEITGYIAKQSVYSGEILRKERFAQRGELGGSALAVIVAPNMRAISVRVNDVIGVAGFLMPGDFVDVLSSKKQGEGRATGIVLERIKVLAVDQTASTDKNTPVIVRAVTLEVSPEDAEVLVDATQEGAVQLALRNPTDDVVVEEKPAEPEQKPEPVAKAEPAPKVVVKERIVYREQPSSKIKFIEGNGSGGVEVTYQKVPQQQ